MSDDPIQPYANFIQLAQNEREGIDYQRHWLRRTSPVLIAAPHGGGIEPGTSEVASALAGERHALYIFEGYRGKQNQRLHIASTRFNDPLLQEMLQEAQYVAAVHGCRDAESIVYVGGLHDLWVHEAIEKLHQAGFCAERDEGHHAGRFPANLCNRARSGMGVQFELSLGLRRQMFASLTRSGRQSPTLLLQHFADTLQPLWS